MRGGQRPGRTADAVTEPPLPTSSTKQDRHRADSATARSTVQRSFAPRLSRGIHDRHHWQEAGDDPAVQRSRAAGAVHRDRGGAQHGARRHEHEHAEGAAARDGRAAHASRECEGREDAEGQSRAQRAARPREEGGSRRGAADDPQRAARRAGQREGGDPDAQRRRQDRRRRSSRLARRSRSPARPRVAASRAW